MFSGIVRSLSSVIRTEPCRAKPEGCTEPGSIKSHHEEFKIHVQRPKSLHFSHLTVGDSVAVNGVCLTLEHLSAQEMQFHLGHETLQLTGWSLQSFQNQLVNLEPALRVGDSVGGHFVSGHIDGMAEVVDISRPTGVSRLLELKMPLESADFFWQKSFVTIHGVSLTVNKVKKNRLSICLVPQTLKQSNLSHQTPGDQVTFEIDAWSRMLMHALKRYHWERGR